MDVELCDLTVDCFLAIHQAVENHSAFRKRTLVSHVTYFQIV
jgi:hypothetical protein